jgi:hypothetical protein
VKLQSATNTGVGERLENAIIELLALQEVLATNSIEVDKRVLADFRQALNRVRNTAWAAQKFVASGLSDEGPASLTSFLAAERVRCAFQLCHSVKEDLQRADIEFQKGQLSELEGVVKGLSKQLQQRL